MSKKPISRTEYKNYNISVYYDDRDTNNPVLSRLNRGVIGYLPYVENLLKIKIFGNLVIGENTIETIEQDNDYVSLPICLVETEYGYGLSVCRIDCQRYGIIYNSKENLDIFQKTEENDYSWAKNVFEKEVRLFSDYIEGRVYGYEITNEKDIVVDSCWGYIGVNDKELIEEAIKIIDKVYSN